MKSRRDVSREGPEALLEFRDVAACFSEEEWKLLHRWQKELYRNVMKEIHQAFSSLGPLIASSVFSLRPEEAEELCSEDFGDFESGAPAGPPCGPIETEPVVSFSIKHEDGLYFSDPTGAAETEHIAGLTTPGVASAAASVGINEEGKTYALDFQDCHRRECFTIPSGKGCTKRRRNVNSLKSRNKSTVKNLKANNAQTVSASSHAASQKPTQTDHSQKGEETAQWQNDSGSDWNTHFNLHPISPIHRSETYITCSTTSRNDITTSDLVQGCTSFTDLESEQTLQGPSHPGRQRIHKVKERYTCAECGKSFNAISNLVRHERIHTGERPYQCTMCGKSFNQKEVLLRHQKMHTGERPYECNICGKCFNRKHHLLEHHKIHAKKQQHCTTDRTKAVDTNVFQYQSDSRVTGQPESQTMVL
ncbi:uncharacterized protein LOC144826116 [Lissotriton helveticus]